MIVALIIFAVASVFCGFIAASSVMDFYSRCRAGHFQSYLFFTCGIPAMLGGALAIASANWFIAAINLTS